MKKLDKLYFYLGILIIVVATVVEVRLSLTGILTYDEAYSMALIMNPFKEVISLTANDVHPPLYYLLLKLFYVSRGVKVYTG